MKLADLTWIEVSEYIKKDNRLIVPVGTCEQHSHHLPLNTDILVCEYFAEYLSNKTGILLAPTVNYGVNLICDQLYYGTANISENTLLNLLQEVIEWWDAQGFKEFIFLSYHGEPLHIKAIEKVKGNCTVIELYDIDYSGILDKQDSVKHACEGETSVMMYLYPERVRKAEILDRYIEDDQFNEYVKEKRLFDRNSFPGCVGYPSAATVEKGKEIVRRTEEKLLNLLENKF
ncbi:creatininase family protein [Natronospora cellulosivora (SeqCode)]